VGGRPGLRAIVDTVDEFREKITSTDILATSASAIAE